MILYIIRRKYLYIKNLVCVWSWINFKEIHPLVIKIWACIPRVGVLLHVTVFMVFLTSKCTMQAHSHVDKAYDMVPDKLW